MSITDELRRMLDERGVECETYTEMSTGIEHIKWSFNEYGSADFNIEFGGPWLTMYGDISSPEQAIEATLGRGTCHIDLRGMDYQCSGCGGVVGSADPIDELYIDGNAIDMWCFCPNCGRKVINS